MSTWAGWQRQFLEAANIIVTPPNLDFMTDWAGHANSPSCGRNPIDLHHPVGGSTNCVKPAGRNFWTQNYGTHAHAAAAFASQVNALPAGAILDTLGSGNPFQDPGYKQVADALRVWASTNFADWYETKVGGSGGGTGGSSATGIHKGWADLQRSVGKHRLRAKIDAANRMDAAALRALRRARKVRIR